MAFCDYAVLSVKGGSETESVGVEFTSLCVF